MANRRAPNTAEIHSTAKESLVLTFGDASVALSLDPAKPGKVGLVMEDKNALVEVSELSPADKKRVASAMRDFAERVEKAEKARAGLGPSTGF